MRILSRFAGLAAALLLLAPSSPEVPTMTTTPDPADRASDPLAARQEAPPTAAVFDLAEVRAARMEHGRPWEEFLRVPDMFMGLYEIAAGQEDRQRPHDADEVYYVLEGNATLLVGEERLPARAGSVLYVAKNLDHRFVDVTEDLSVLVVFATATEGS